MSGVTVVHCFQSDACPPNSNDALPCICRCTSCLALRVAHGRARERERVEASLLDRRGHWMRTVGGGKFYPEDLLGPIATYTTRDGVAHEFQAAKEEGSLKDWHSDDVAPLKGKITPWGPEEAKRVFLHRYAWVTEMRGTRP